MEQKPLINISQKSSLIPFSEIWRYKDLLYFMVWRDITVLYKQTILGFAWAILNPLFQIVIFSVVFGYLANIKPDVEGTPYFLFSALSVIPWTYFSNSLTTAANSLLSGGALINKVYFPRIILPLTPVLSKLVDFIVSLTIVGALLIIYQVNPGLRILLLPIPFFLVILTAMGMGTLFATLVIQFRDIRFALSFLTPLLMYLAPVAFPATLVLEKMGTNWYHLYAFYPMVGAIESFRACFISDKPFPWELVAISYTGALILFFIGVWYFKKTENFFADIA